MNAVVNLLPTIAPKSDQLNADDLIGRSMTIKVTSVKLSGAPDQPIAIHFEGDDGKPYMPCKSMRRVLVHVWGTDGNAYAGRRLALYRDDKVQFGGMAVGGIRISHMSDIDQDVTMALTATRANRKPFTVRPLKPEAGGEAINLPAVLKAGEAAAVQGSAKLTAWWQGLSKAEKAAAKPTLDTRLKPMAAQADQASMDDDATDEPPEVEAPVIDETPDEPEAEDDFPGTKALAGLKTGKQLLDEQTVASLTTWASDLTDQLPSMDGAGLEALLADPESVDRFKKLDEHKPDVAQALDRTISRRRKELDE